MAILLIGLAMGTASSALAEAAWVRGGIRINLRTEPGTKFRIIGVITTGDGVQVMSRADEWTQVRVTSGEAQGKTGWIPAGYLQAERPASLLVGQLSGTNAELEEQVAKLSQELAAVKEERDLLSGTDDEQVAEIERLTMDNMRLRAGARYPEWITGAGILAAGMAVGAILRGTSRRQQARIRL